MRSWRYCLDAAGVRGDAARADYSAAARYCQRRHFESWVPMRMLAPPASHPHLAAAAAIARYTDDLCDRGPVGERARKFEQWADHVGAALDTAVRSSGCSVRICTPPMY